MNTSAMMVTGGAAGIIVPRGTDKHTVVVFVVLVLSQPGYQGMGSKVANETAHQGR